MVPHLQRQALQVLQRRLLAGQEVGGQGAAAGRVGQLVEPHLRSRITPRSAAAPAHAQDTSYKLLACSTDEWLRTRRGTATHGHAVKGTRGPHGHAVEGT